MIVDTSALAAIILVEPKWQTFLETLSTSACVVPAPVLTELQLLTASRPPAFAAAASALIVQLLQSGAQIAAFDHNHATITASARVRFGRGNGRGGLLNFGDLMVYAIAKQRREPLLCTGRDFVSTDLEIHPASRIDP